MSSAHINSLPQSPRTAIMPLRVKYARVKHEWALAPNLLAPSLLIMGLLMNCAHAQQAAQPGPKRDDLDVTMQIIVDPDAKLPDEVVRRIPLPERKPADQSTTAAGGDKSTKDNAAENKERAREAKELGRELGQSAKEKAQEAAEQREQARRSAAEERRRNPPEPPPTPNPPGRPPRS
jgi:septal ring factor EnvC (AmiA/AmiB activator)